MLREELEFDGSSGVSLKVVLEVVDLDCVLRLALKEGDTHQVVSFDFTDEQQRRAAMLLSQLLVSGNYSGIDAEHRRRVSQRHLS